MSSPPLPDLDALSADGLKRLVVQLRARVAGLEEENWTSSLGVEGSLTNPDTPGGQDGGEEDPAAVHRRVQGRGGQAAAGRRQGAGRGRDRAGAEPRAAERVAQRAPGGGLGGGAGRPQGRAGRAATAQAREQAARGGGRDPQEGRGFFRPGDRVSRFAFVAAERANHAVAALCRVVGASVSGFYAWLRAIPVTRV